MVVIRDAIKQAQRMHREAVEAAYDGVCRIYNMQSVKDPKTKVTSQTEVLVAQNIPCRLSYSSASPDLQSGTAATVSQTIKLFLAPELIVPPGSRIEVTQQTRTESYGQSGKAAVYASHQEIMLELWRGYA